MILLICAEERGGVMFFGRRVSRDRAVIARVLELTKGKRLVLTPYSRRLFPEDAPVFVSPTPETEAKEGDFVFAEDGAYPTEGVERIHLFRFLRSYPADRIFLPEEHGFSLKETASFPGFSHEEMREEIYEVQR